MKTEVSLASLDHGCLRSGEPERQDARELAVVADTAHELKAGTVDDRPLRQRDEITADRQAGVGLDVIDAAEHFRRNHAAVK